MPTSPLDPDAKDEDSTHYAMPKSSAAAGPASGRYLPGALLSGKYRLDALLGEGGMGSVWRASNLLLDLPVAIKLIRADLDRGALRARLQLEARSAAKLGHPAIVRVFDVGESEFGDPFIVMELLQGETLASMLLRGRLSGAHAAQLLLPIIDALGMAHARGIVHRDLKPDNLMIALEDHQVQPKILDFGIAKLIDPPASDHKLTEAGAVVGSPDYMSPEQARGREDLDASTDIWSLCVVLYEAVTGFAPFSATNYNALLRAIVEDQPQSIVERAAGDAALWAIISRGLAKNRSQRYQSMPELGQALAVWLLGHGVREDAAGASIEAKWLAHGTDPASISTRSLATARADFQPKATQDSHPGGTGVGRGPFTHTILPHASNRTRVVGALALVALLVSAGALALRHAVKPEASAAPRPAAHIASGLSAAEPPPLVSIELPSPAAVAPAADVASVVTPAIANAVPVAPARPATPVTHRAPVPASPPSLSSSRSSEPAVSAPLSNKLAASATAVPAPPKVRDRPLDLLAPY